MIVALEVVVLVALGLLAVYGVVATVVNRPPDRRMRLAVAGAMVLLVVQAAIGALRVLLGVTLPETTTFLIYLAVSVIVLPLATQFATASDEETGGPTRWGGTVIAVGAVATAVAVVRLQYLWDARV